LSEAALNLGRSLTDSDIRAGLFEMNPSISFDAAINRPSEYRFVLKGDNMTDVRGGIFYNGMYVCAYDRGVVPELPIWSMTDGIEEIRMCDIEKYDDTRVCYVQIMESDPHYHIALTKAESKDDNFVLDDDGKVYKYTALRECRVRDKIIRIGWRRTLVHVATAGIPGVTIDTVNAKFGVRL